LQEFWTDWDVETTWLIDRAEVEGTITALEAEGFVLTLDDIEDLPEVIID